MNINIEQINSSTISLIIQTENSEIPSFEDPEVFSFHSGWVYTKDCKWSWDIEKSNNSYADNESLKLILEVVEYLDKNFTLYNGNFTPIIKKYEEGDSFKIEG